MSLDTAKLTKLLADKCQLLTQLRQLGARQFQSIDTADLSQLLNLLAAKQRLIGGLQTIEQQLDPYREQSPDEREWASPADRQQCASLLKRVSNYWLRWSKSKSKASTASCCGETKLPPACRRPTSPAKHARRTTARQELHFPKSIYHRNNHHNLARITRPLTHLLSNVCPPP